MSNVLFTNEFTFTFSAINVNQCLFLAAFVSISSHHQRSLSEYQNNRMKHRWKYYLSETASPDLLAALRLTSSAAKCGSDQLWVNLWKDYLEVMKILCTVKALPVWQCDSVILQGSVQFASCPMKSRVRKVGNYNRKECGIEVACCLCLWHCFSCPRQLNRWHCHWFWQSVSQRLIFWFQSR